MKYGPREAERTVADPRRNVYVRPQTRNVYARPQTRYVYVPREDVGQGSP